MRRAIRSLLVVLLLAIPLLVLAESTPKFGLQFGRNETDNTNLTSLDTKAPKYLRGAFTTDFPGATNACSPDVTFTVNGALVGDLCVVGTPTAPTGSMFSCFVATINVITLRHCAVGTSDPPSQTYLAAVLQ